MPASTLSPVGKAAQKRPGGAPPGVTYRCDLAATCLPLSAWLDRESIWPGTIHKLSTGGLVLVLKRRFEVGSGLTVELPASDERTEEKLLVKVTRIESVPGGGWLLGCTFLNALTEEAVLTLVGAAAGRGAVEEASHGPDNPTADEQPQGPTFLDGIGARYQALPVQVRLSLQAAGLLLGIAVSFGGLMLLVRRAAGW